MFVLTAMLAPAACDYFASPDELGDPDVISIAMVLVAGESEAHLLAGRPFLGRFDPPPRVAATLIGPGWRAAFTHKTDPKEGCGRGPTIWAIPLVCLNATLPEPIREEVTYRLEGTGPKGSFTGETTVPAAPVILAPAGTVWLPRSKSVVRLRLPIRYAAPPEVGVLRPEVFQTVGNSTGTDSRWVGGLLPRELDLDDQEVTLVWSYTPSLRLASLHLLGIGRQYGHFWKKWTSFERSVKWPSVGLSGEGVYGYFDGSAKSRPVEIRLEDEG